MKEKKTPKKIILDWSWMYTNYNGFPLLEGDSEEVSKENDERSKHWTFEERKLTQYFDYDKYVANGYSTIGIESPQQLKRLYSAITKGNDKGLNGISMGVIRHSEMFNKD